MDDADKDAELAWRAGLKAALAGHPSAINPHPGSALAEVWRGGWKEGERLRWSRQVRLPPTSE